MSSTYNLRPTSYSPAHLDRELALRGAHTSGSLERKQERLQRFVDAEKNAPVKHHQKVIELRRTIVRPPTPSRRSSRIEELQRSIVNIPTTTPEVRRSSRISQLLNQYLGY
jgi:hypothetical protein